MTITKTVTVDNLSDVMEFDHVIQVHADGTVTDDHPDVRSLWAPELLDGILSGSDGWTLLDGYSGQDRYTGPEMHASESIGGQMAADILARPGFYVALVANYSPEDEEAELDAEGWAVAYRPAP